VVQHTVSLLFASAPGSGELPCVGMESTAAARETVGKASIDVEAVALIVTTAAGAAGTYEVGGTAT